MARSLVRVHHEAKQLNTKEYRLCIAEFIVKMGGTRQVVQEIMHLQRVEEPTLLFDNTPQLEPELEDFMKAM